METTGWKAYPSMMPILPGKKLHMSLSENVTGWDGESNRHIFIVMFQMRSHMLQSAFALAGFCLKKTPDSPFVDTSLVALHSVRYQRLNVGQGSLHSQKPRSSIDVV